MTKTRIPRSDFEYAKGNASWAERLTVSNAEVRSLYGFLKMTLGKMTSRITSHFFETRQEIDDLASAAAELADVLRISWNAKTEEPYRKGIGHQLRRIKATKKKMAEWVVGLVGRLKTSGPALYSALSDAICEGGFPGAYYVQNYRTCELVKRASKPDVMCGIEIGWGRKRMIKAINRLAETRGWNCRLEGEEGVLTDISSPDDVLGPSRYISMDDANDVWYTSCTGRTIARFHSYGRDSIRVEIWNDDGRSYSRIRLYDEDAERFDWGSITL